MKVQTWTAENGDGGCLTGTVVEWDHRHHSGGTVKADDGKEFWLPGDSVFRVGDRVGFYPMPTNHPRRWAARRVKALEA